MGYFVGRCGDYYWLLATLAKNNVLTIDRLFALCSIESIVPEILNLNKMFLPIEENVETMLCKYQRKPLCPHGGDQQL